MSHRIAADDGWAALRAWRRLSLTRYAVHGLLERVWDLRDNLSAYDAGYVALAESLDCSLVTADADQPRPWRSLPDHCRRPIANWGLGSDSDIVWAEV